MKNNLLNIDWNLLLPAIVLILLSLTTLLSLSTDLFRSQLVFFVISLAVFFLISQIQWEGFQHYAKPIYFLALLALFISLVVGIESRGAIRWLDILGVRFQFS